MRISRSLLAGWLLLCFMRVLLPEAWVLDLHAHRHTTEEPAQRHPDQDLLSAKHQHCAVDNFYHVPFQLAPPLELPQASAMRYHQAKPGLACAAGQPASTAVVAVRGPPISV